jgi:hypothetical protein
MKRVIKFWNHVRAFANNIILVFSDECETLSLVKNFWPILKEHNLKIKWKKTGILTLEVKIAMKLA